MSKKKYFNLLPEVLQTDVNKTFYDATYEQLFSAKDNNMVDGFVGRRTNKQWDPQNDNYLLEATRNRTWYQLEPSVLTNNIDATADENHVFYEDYINILKQYGANVSNHDRLFSGKYYSFCPPIDVDKLTNSHAYKWVKDLPILTLINITDNEISDNIIGNTSYTHNGGFIHDGNEFNDVIVLTSGLRVQFHASSAYKGVYFVEGVGSNIRLVEESLEPTEYSKLDEINYVTIERGSLDGNTWSRRNRWVHVEVLEYVQKLIKQPIEVMHSSRPIIEFIRDISLYDFGSTYITDVQYIISDLLFFSTPISQTLPDAQKLIFTFSHDITFPYIWEHTASEDQPYVYTLPMPILDTDDITVNVTRGMTVYSDVDWFSIEEQNNQISFRAYSDNQIWNNVIDDIEGILPGDEIQVIVGTQNIVLNSLDYVWVVKKQDNDTILYPYGTRSNVLPIGSLVYSSGGFNYVKDQTTWSKDIQQYINKYSTPKFDLFYTLKDGINPISLSTLDSDFNGSEIFSYKRNELNPYIDMYIGMPLEYKNLGQVSDIVFEHDLITNRYNQVINDELVEIKGYYYFKVGSEYKTTWILNEQISKQRVVDNIVIKTFKEVVEQTEFYNGVATFKLNSSEFVAPTSIKVYVKNGLNFIETTNFNYAYANAVTQITINDTLVNGDEIKIIFSYGDTFKLSVAPNQLDGDIKDVFCFKDGNKLKQNVDFFIVGGDILHLNADFAYNDVITVKSYSDDPLPDDQRGYYEIPKQLESNPLNEEVYEYSLNDLTKHFGSIIEYQDNFDGNMYSINNFRDTKKDLSLGTEILQTSNNMLKSSLVLQQNKYNIMKSINLSSTEYVRYKDKLIAIVNQIEKERDYRETDNVVIIDSVVKEAIERMNNSSYYNGAFSTVNMFCHSEFYFEQMFDSSEVAGGLTLNIIDSIDLDDPSNGIYVYRGNMDVITGEFLLSKMSCDVRNVDYEITSNDPITIQINNHVVGQDVLVRVYKDSINSYMPTTPTKNGMYKSFIPSLKIDDTYANNMYVVVGHDGSITPIQMSNKVIYTDFNAVDVTSTVDGAIYTVNKHGFKTGQMVIFHGETYAGGHENGVIYHVIKISNDTFKLANSEYNAYQGNALLLASSTINVGELSIFPIMMSDLVLLEIETRIYNNLNEKFYGEYYPLLTKEDIFSGLYTKEELEKIERRAFLNWKNDNNANYKDNSTVDYDNWKTWNYRSVNPSLPGNWKGIFIQYYGTIRPHECPWEMLGFSSKPTWWDSEYGVDYSSSNISMWTDLQNGYIRQGSRQGTNPTYARPSLLSMIPVDTSGQLLSPHDIGIAIEPQNNKELDWVFGDMGPVEYMWRVSSEYIFSLMQTLLLARPASFGELFFDTNVLTNAQIDVDQIISSETFMRFTPNNYYVTGEEKDKTTVLNYGYQNFIIDYLQFNSNSISEFGNAIRTLQTKLGYKVGGFVDSNSIDIYMQSVGLNSKNVSLVLPKENVNVALFKAPTIEEYVYSGLIIKRTIDGKFYISGYDSFLNEFSYVVRPVNAKYETIVIGGKSPNYSYFKIGQPYVKGQIVKYKNAFHECVVDHSPTAFVEQYWVRLPSLPTYGGKTITLCKNYTGNIGYLEYGSILDDEQQVVDFIVGYGIWLKNAGWIFDEINEETNEIEDWVKAAKDFVYWSSMNFGTDNVLFLNPSANKLKLKVSYGYPDQIKSKNDNGYTGIADQYGFPIDMVNVYVHRDEQTITVESMDSKMGINLLRVPVTQYEHIIVLDNTSIFNDIIKDDVLNDRQSRIRFSGVRSSNWYGKLEANGYLINGNQLLINADNRIESLRHLYDEDVKIDNKQMEDAAKHIIGFQERSYLDDLRISGDTQFKFYKGLVTEKGTKSSINKILRSEFIEGNDSIGVYEEWAVKLSEFGAIDNEKVLEFNIDPTDIKTEPQLVNIDYNMSDVKSLRVNEIKIINAPTPYQFKPMIEIDPPINGGKKAMAEIVLDKNGFMDSIIVRESGQGYTTEPSWKIKVYDKNTKEYVQSANNEQLFFVMGREVTVDNKYDQTISIDIDDHERWVSRPHGLRYEHLIPTITEYHSLMPYAGYVHLDDVDFSVINVDAMFSLYNSKKIPQTNNYIWVADATSSKEQKLWSVYKVVQISLNTPDMRNSEVGDFFVYESTVYRYVVNGETGNIEELYYYDDDNQNDIYDSFVAQLQNQGTSIDLISVQTFKSVRYSTLSDVPLQDGQYAESRFWVDDVSGRWEVHDNGQLLRSQPQKYINSYNFKNAILFDSNNNELVRLETYDPIKNVIPGIVDSNITYKSDVDPTHYVQSNDSLLVNEEYSFGEKQVGLLWWDLSTCRYIDYEQGDANYKRDNWGKLVEGSSIDIYEWVKSYDVPNNYTGDGVPKNIYDYVTRKQFSQVTGDYITVYYFWVKDRFTIPKNIKHRTLPSFSIASMLLNPAANGVRWFNFITHDDNNSEFLFSNISDVVYDSPFIMQINYSMEQDKNQNHAEWKLLREGDKNEIIPNNLWSKLVDSISEIDKLGNIVPDPKLSPRERYGINIRPRQSMVSNINEARRNVCYAINLVLNNYNMKDSGVNWDLQQSEFWEWIDWYEQGYTKENTIPVKQILTYDEDVVFSGTKNGDIIKQYDKNDSTWFEIVDVDSKQIKVVRREKAAINVTNKFYTLKNNNAQRQFIRDLLNKLNDEVYVGEYKYAKNNLFFTVINYVHTEPTLIDWLFKTTYISISHEGQVLSQTNFYRPTTVESFLSYINEVKPYQTKLREYNLKYSSPLDAINYNAWDFDSLSYETETEANQELGNPSSIAVVNPSFDPYSVTRIFKVCPKYDAIQCGFSNKDIYIDLGEETKVTSGLVNFLIFDNVKTVSKVICDGFELPSTYYDASMTEDGKVKLTFTQGLPSYGHVITVESGVTFTHTMLEEARLFNSIGYKDQQYHISSRYKNISASFVRSNNDYDGHSTITLTNSQWKKSLGYGSKVTIYGSQKNDGQYRVQQIDGYTLVIQNSGNGKIESIQVLSGGIGYQVGDELVIINGSGTSAILTVSSIDNYGEILSVVIKNGGNGYSSSDTGLICTTNGSGYSATFKVLKIQDELINETITNPKSELRFTVENYGATAIYDLKTTIYGQVKSGFGNFKFGKIPFGQGGVATETDVNKHIPFSIHIGATNRILHSNKSLSSNIKKIAFKDAPLYSEYCEKGLVPTYKETQALEMLQETSHSVLGCDFEGYYIDGEDYLYGMTQPWDSEKWDVEGEYPSAGWDRELVNIGSINPMAVNGFEYTFDYNNLNSYEVPFIIPPEFIKLIEVVQTTSGVETITEYTGAVTPSYQYDEDGDSEYKTTLSLDDMPAYEYNPPDYDVKVRIYTKAMFTFLSTGDNTFKIPYLLSGISVCDIVDSIVDSTATLTVNSGITFSSSVAGNDTSITLSSLPTSSSASPLVKAYVTVAYDHENSNVFDNGELFNTLDASYFAEEFFDEGMTGELARYNVTESVVINVDTNCAYQQISYISDGASSYVFNELLTNSLVGSIEVQVDNVLFVKDVDYTIDLNLQGKYVINFITVVNNGDEVVIGYKNNSSTMVFSADDVIHWDSEEVAEIFFNGAPVNINHLDGFDTGPFDCDVVYRSKYLIPTTTPLLDPTSVNVYLLEDSISGITSSVTQVNAVDYDIMSVNDYINNYVLVAFPSANYNDVLDNLMGEYSGVTDIVNPASFVNSYSVILFNDSHINPIEDNVTATAHAHLGKPSNKVVCQFVVDEISYTVHMQDDGGITYTRNSDSYSTTLYEAVSPDDIEIKVVDGTIFDQPSIYSPGVIWINNERITFTHIENNGPYYTLKGVTRATKGTSLPTGLIKYGHGEITSLTLNSAGSNYSAGDILVINDNKGRGATILVISVAMGGAIDQFSILSGGKGYEKNSINTISGGTGSGATINIDSISSGGKYPSGEKVFYGDNSQFIPSGNQWLWTNSSYGLSTSTTNQAMFLRSSTGCKI